MSLQFIAALVSSVVCLTIFRVWSILPAGKHQKRHPKPKRASCTLAIFLGSGGHTSEALSLLQALDFERYSKRIYIASQGDSLSISKAVELENLKTTPGKCGGYSVITIPRARHVHQPLLTTPPTALVSLFSAFYHLTCSPFLNGGFNSRPFADALILNGPGTCFVLCAIIYLNKFIGLPAPELIYIESFARVRSLSLSGKLLRPLVDRFIVQWPQILDDQGRGECSGWLV
ncbi:oligosaccharide biosynthesis protein Alg14 like protein [Pluteus cervinus]|uniref:Oligosaccharide biosynthesis protein Alg14 like protein n=1 Tax=Pluteus cervinus TaxID=181527 RepID=A0ACD3BC07_9AGAR|nr:oligosaccharide biosynthesis protein Alg14 like protein [Pluteus cervinus]